MRHACSLPLALAVLLALPVKTQTVPNTINYQGRLTDNTAAKTPVNGTLPFSFAIFAVENGGAPLWSETADILVSDGVFSVALGSATPIPASLFTDYYYSGTPLQLEITVNAGTASAETLWPRQPILSTAFSYRSEHAASANSATNAASASIASNAIQLGGVPSSGYLTTSATAYDSTRLGGTSSNGWQKSLATTSCPANQFYTGIAQDGTASCAFPPVGGSGINGAGTANQIAKFTASNTIGNSSLSDDGTTVFGYNLSAANQVFTAGMTVSGNQSVGGNLTVSGAITSNSLNVNSTGYINSLSVNSLSVGLNTKTCGGNLCTCDPGGSVIGGGTAAFSPGSVTASYPSGNSWISVCSNSSGSVVICNTTRVICASMY